MKRLVFLYILIFSFQFTKAQFQFETGARQGGMAGVGVVMPDIWSSYHNQSGLADLKGFSAGIFYSAVFNIPELKDAAVALAMPVDKFGTVGTNYSISGNEASNFSKFGFAYAKRLGKRFTAGIQINYLRFAQAEYGNSGAATGEIGLIAEPLDNLFIGAHVFNPWRAKMSGMDEYLPSVLRVGAGYFFSKKVLLTVETQKDLDKPIVFRAGTEYNLIAGLFLRTGIMLKPVKYSFGIGYNYKGIMLDVAYLNHDYLGYYFQFGLAYAFSKKSKAETD